MATYDDYDGVYFSVQAIRLYHPEVTDRTEIVVLDNHPSGPCAGPLKDLEHRITGYRYVPHERVQGTAVRDLLFREANAEFVLCVDSHVLFRPGALSRLLDYLETNPDSPDLWQGPLLGDDLNVCGTHFDPVWSGGMYGKWAIDPRGLDPDAPPFEIPMQGLGVFGCRREAWPGLNPRLRGFGGEEGYLHEKIRRAGGRTLCLPFLGWVHRFSRPFGPRYVVSVADRVRNYMLVHGELGLDPAPAIEHLEREFGAEQVRPVVERVEREMRGPFHFFDAIYCISLDRESARWESIMRQGAALGIDARIRRFPAVETPALPQVGRALSLRGVIAEARWLGLDNVLVIEDGAVFRPDTAEVLARSLVELRQSKWELLHLGGDRPGEEPTEAPGCRSLRIAHGPLGLPAVAYHHAVYDRVLAEVPATPTAVARWLEAHRDVEHFLAKQLGGARFLTSPSVAACRDLAGREPSPDAPA